MNHRLLNTLLWVAGIITAVYMICEAIREGRFVLVNANLASQKLEHEHQERMIDKLVQYHRQASRPMGHMFHVDSFRPTP